MPTELFCHPTARDFTSFHHFCVDLDVGSDIYLIENGKVPAILQHPESLYRLLAPLPTDANKVQLTWRSFPLVSRPFSNTMLGVGFLPTGDIRPVCFFKLCLIVDCL